MLKDFIVGSSVIVFLPFFLAVSRIPRKDRNYTYIQYTLVAPIFLGLMNVIGGILFPKYRYVLTGLLSGITVAIIASLLNSYNYTSLQWHEYYIRIILKHVLVFGIIINGLDYYMSCKR